MFGHAAFVLCVGDGAELLRVARGVDAAVVGRLEVARALGVRLAVARCDASAVTLGVADAEVVVLDAADVGVVPALG